MRPIVLIAPLAAWPASRRRCRIAAAAWVPFPELSGEKRESKPVETPRGLATWGRLNAGETETQK
jgi:hypothetical protein